MKLDDDLYDYDGKCWRTRQDEECTEIMENILREDEFGNMSDKDKSLLEEFASKLFNTAKYSDFVVEGMMRDVCSGVRGYREGNGSFKFVDKEGVRLKGRGKTKERTDALKNHATAILEILGDPSKYGDIDYLTKNYEILMGIKKMMNNPSYFLQMEIKCRPKRKTKIKNMLQNIELISKTPEIDNFIKELENTQIKQS